MSAAGVPLPVDWLERLSRVPQVALPEDLSRFPVPQEGGRPSAVLMLFGADGDGAPDLAVPNYGSNTAGILPGNGDGTFQAALTFPTGAGTSPVVVIPM